MKYVALLRGINVGGNNTVPMTDLRACFEALGYREVRTYINSGNVLFETAGTDETTLARSCEVALRSRFGFSIRLAVFRAESLIDMYKHAPAWWGTDDGVKHNALFIITPATTDSVMTAVGESKPEYEKVAAYDRVIFWSAPLKTFSRTRWSKIVGTAAYGDVTIRGASTVRKLVALCSF